MNDISILVVDDDEVTRKLLQEVLVRDGHSITLASSGEEALQFLDRGRFAVILSDIRMLQVDGMRILTEVKIRGLDSVVILMTGFGNLEGAVQAIQKGAFDYISKPFRMEELRSLVSRAAKQWKGLRGQRGAFIPAKPEFRAKTLLGKSPQIVDVYKSLARAALSPSSVLIEGESGTGKELAAHAIHDNSPRRDRKFVAVNCGALTESLLESELFGHVKGAFTGASADKKGLFEEASGGSIFLDEVGDISPALQVKLLRVLQEGEIKPVGSNEVRKVDARVIAATHRNLEQLVKEEKFREDLFYRLKVITIELPPLRRRMEDLPELVGHFLALYADKNKKKISHMADETMELLQAYSWPGNVRELEHAIERAVAMSTSNVLFPEDFPEIKKAVLGGAADRGDEGVVDGLAEGESLEAMEKQHILKVLKEVNYNKSKASEILGIDRATLYRKAQRYKIELKSEK